MKRHLIPAAITNAQAAFTYASEADLLNVALFGQTAKNGATPIPSWRATCATTPPSSNCSCWPTSKA